MVATTEANPVIGSAPRIDRSGQRPTVERRSAERRSAERLLAERLLADDEVRSVTIDRLADHATVRYRDRRQVAGPLAEIARRAQSDTLSLRQAAAGASPAVLCWADAETGRDDYVRRPRPAVGWRRTMHLGLAGLWFALAMIGVVVPGMPTTCFLLLTSYSLARSSERLHRRLLDSRWFGPSLRDWRTHRGVRPGVKTKALSAMAIAVGLSVTLAGLPAAANAGIVFCASIGAFCVARLRVIRDDGAPAPRPTAGGFAPRLGRP
ncbi:MAG: YbaN family protein [Planctomycetota bacterium]